MQTAEAPGSSSGAAKQRAKPCKICRARKVSCDRDPHSVEPCGRCRARGQVCEVEEPVALSSSSNRHENEHAAMRAQMQRFERVLDALERKAGLLPPTAPAEYPAAVEVDDLVGTLNNMLLAADGIDDSGEHTRANDELLQDAQRLLLTLTPVVRSHSGFVLDSTSVTDALSLQELVERLPAWSVADELLQVFPRLWVFFRMALHAPDYPLRVEALYRSGFKPLPPPAIVAELFAVLCLVQTTLASKSARDTEVYGRLQAEADTFAGCAFRALTLADYLAAPTIDSCRATYLLAASFISAAKETSSVRKALALLPMAVSMVFRLKLHLVDDDLVAKETPLQAYERRALVNVVTREDAHFSLLYTKHSFALDAGPIKCPLPEPLDDEDLPAALQDSPYRISRVTMQGFVWRAKMVVIRKQIVQDVWLRRVVEYSEVKRIDREIDELEAEMPSEWVVTPGQSYQAFADKELNAGRFTVSPGVSQLRVMLHRPFIAYRKPVSGMTAADVAWHRDKVLSASEALINIGLAFEEESGLYVTMSYPCIDAAISSCLLVSMDPDYPKATRVRALATAYVARGMEVSSPGLIKRLSRLLLWLLDRPRARRNDPMAPCQAVKRGRYGLTELTGPHSASAAVSHAGSSSHAFSMPDFEVSNPLTEDDYRRKSSTSTTNDISSAVLARFDLGDVELNDTLGLLEQLDQTDWTAFALIGEEDDDVHQ